MERPVAGADVRRFSHDRRGLALNFFLGIASGALLTLADTLVLATIVLPIFVAQLTDSHLAIGAIPALGAGLWTLTHLVAGSLTGGRRRQAPWATAAALVRAAAMGLLAYVALDTNGDPTQLLRAFLICYGAYAVAGGLAAPPTTSMVAKAVPGDGRAVFFRQRAVWGGALAVVAGVVVARLLGEDGPSFPRRGFALLFLASAVCLGAATFFIASLREPFRIPGPRQAGLGDALRALPAALANPNYRRFLGFRLPFALAAAADPFYVVYAVRQVGIDIGVAGLYVVVLVVASLAGRLLWGPLVRHAGDRAVLQSAALARLLVPLVALIVPYLIETEVAADRFDDQRLAAVLIGAAIAVHGLALGAHERAGFSYLFDLVPEPQRLGYFGLTNLLLAVVACASLAAGVLVDREGFRLLFLVTALMGLIAVFTSGALTDTNVRARRPGAAWGLRRPATAPDTRR